MHPSKFAGFASMTIMGADLMDSIFYHYYTRLGVEFRENCQISVMVRQHCIAQGKRHDVHNSGDRLTILRLTDRPWSKSLRKMLVEHQDRDYPVIDLYCKAVNERAKGMPKLWVANNDVPNAFIDGTPVLRARRNASTSSKTTTIASCCRPSRPMTHITSSSRR